MNRLFNLREEYTQGELDENQMPEFPIEQFNKWMRDAIDAELSEPNAMVLATCTRDGKPSARIVLLKEVSADGFVFFTNYMSRKGNELSENSASALVFDWHEIERQVRIEGNIEKVSETDSDTYFNARPSNSRLGAWASPQSRVLKNREELENLQKEFEEKFSNRAIPRPPHWGGYVLSPTSIEFWQGRPGRLHDRVLYTLTSSGWEKQRLAP